MAAIAALLTASCGSTAPGDNALRDVRTLSADAMQGRAAGTPGSAMARAYIVKRMEEAGISPVGGGIEHPFDFQHGGAAHKGVNLIGQIKSSGGGDRVLVLMAHYDHLGVRNGQIYNGADDNASGVAAVLASAESFARSKPRNTVIFAILDAEEMGLSGAKALVADPPVPLDRIAIVMNLDMVSKSAKGELYAAGGHHFAWLKPRLNALAGDVPVILKQGHDGPPWTGQDDWTGASDHAVFHKAGVPWLYLGVEDHPEYHQPTDDADTIPVAFYANAVRTVEIIARRLDQDLDAIVAESRR